MKVDNWIYVTGAPRSGTTFVGLVLSAPLSVDYIHEPFNPDCGMPGVEQRYLYLRRGIPHEQRYRGLIEGLLNYDVKLRTGFYPRDSQAKRVIKYVTGSRGPFYLRLARMNPFHRAAVVKDPIGCLATRYLVENFGFKAVVLLRHPGAFVASTRRLGWQLDSHLANLAAQKELVEDHFPEEPEFLTQPRRDEIESGAALWRALNKVLLKQAKHVRGMRIVTHEELSKGPIPRFRQLFDDLDLPWSARVERKIRRQTSAKNPVEARRDKTQHFSRDSAQLLENRLSKLTADERKRIYEITHDVAEAYYPESSFQP